MINFRFHLVSLVAVFLALAVGIIVGRDDRQPGDRRRPEQPYRPGREERRRPAEREQDAHARRRSRATRTSRRPRRSWWRAGSPACRLSCSPSGASTATRCGTSSPCAGRGRPGARDRLARVEVAARPGRRPREARHDRRRRRDERIPARRRARALASRLGTPAAIRTRATAAAVDDDHGRSARPARRARDRRVRLDRSGGAERHERPLDVPGARRACHRRRW